MATITVHCSHCGAGLKLKDRSKLGKKVACPKCKQPFVLTASDDAGEDEWDDLGSMQSSGRALPPRPSSSSKPKPKKKASSDGSGQTGLLIGVGVLALLAIIGGGIWVAGSMLGGGGNGAAPAGDAAVADAAPGESDPAADGTASDPAAGHGGPASQPESAPAPNIPESQMDLAWLPSDTELLFRLRPADLIATPVMQGLLEGSGETDPFAFFQQQTGVSPRDIEAVAVGMPGITDAIRGTVEDIEGLKTGEVPAGPGMSPATLAMGRVEENVVAVVRFRNPIDASQLRLPGSGGANPAMFMGGAADTTNMEAALPADLSGAMPAESTPGPSGGHGASGRSAGPAAGHGSSGSSSGSSSGPSSGHGSSGSSSGPSGGHGSSGSTSGSSSAGPSGGHGSSSSSSGSSGPSGGHGSSSSSGGSSSGGPSGGHGSDSSSSSGGMSSGPSGGHGSSSSGSSSSGSSSGGSSSGGSSSGGPAGGHGSSGNSSGGSSSSGNTGSGPQYFTVQRPDKPEQPLTLCLVDSRTLLAGEDAAVRRIVERGPDATLPTTFNYLGEGRQISLAFNVTRVPALVKKFEDSGTEVPQGVVELIAMLDSGATGISLGIALNSGLALDVSMAGDNPEAGQRLHEVATSLVEQISESFEMGRDQMPPMAAPFVTPLVENLQANRSENIVRITTSLPDETLNNGAQMAQSMLPMLMMSMMAGGMGGGNASMTMGGGGDFGGMSSGEEVLTEGVPAAEVEGAPDGVELKGLAAWSTMQNFNGGVTPPAPLLVRLGLSGGPAGQVVSYGNVRVLEALTDAGERLKQTRPDMMINDQYFGFIDVERGNFSGQPADATIVSLAFYHPVEDARALQSLAGEVTLKVADESRQIIVPDVSTLIDREPSDPDLAAAGLKVTRQQFEVGGQTLSISYDQSSGVMVSNVTAVNAAGLPLQSVVSGHSILNGVREFTISPLQGNQLPPSLGLQVTIQKGLTEIPVSFRFSDLEIPEPPAPLSAEQRPLVTWRPSTESNVPIDDVQVQGQVQWSQFASFSNGQQQEPPLVIAVDVVGPGAENVVAVGDLEVRTAMIEVDRPLKKRQDGFSFGDGFEKVDRTFLTDSMPVDGVRARFEFEPPGSVPESIQAFSGSVALRTVREQKAVQIDRLSKFVGRRVSHVDLGKAGVQLALIDRGGQHQLSLIKGSPSRIQSIELTDDTGQVLKDTVVNRAEINGKVFYPLAIGDHKLDGLGLKITVNVGMRDIEVPFRFLDLPVPAKPEPQKQGGNQFEMNNNPEGTPGMSAPGMSTPGTPPLQEPQFESASGENP
ncbi:hypothetical protein [Maioricimonas sp. JC845]|uniref:hypothetical protein n=1 Tax=Maioricimonas sp. JC845 TaxID=3232138 RepID=UPI00345AE699